MLKLKSGESNRAFSHYQESLFSFKGELTRADFRAKIIQQFAALYPEQLTRAVLLAIKELTKET